MDRKLIDYLPSFIQAYKQIEAIMDAEQVEIEAAWEKIEETLNNVFVMTANEEGIKLWECLFGIVPKLTATLDERQFTVLSRLNEQNVYTYKFLEFQLTLLCGENGYLVDLKPNEYLLHVKIELTAKSKENDVRELLQRICPANLLLAVTLLYNQHQMLRYLTHLQMKELTHQHLREEALQNG